MKASITLTPVAEGGVPTLPPRTPYGAHYITFTRSEFEGCEVTATFEEEPVYGKALNVELRPLRSRDFGTWAHSLDFDLYAGAARLGSGVFDLPPKVG